MLIPRIVSGMYGFPSEEVDDPALGLVMSEADRFPLGVERRLFYVPLTRAKQRATPHHSAGTRVSVRHRTAQGRAVSRVVLEHRSARGRAPNVRTRFACAQVRTVRAVPRLLNVPGVQAHATGRHTRLTGREQTSGQVTSVGGTRALSFEVAVMGSTVFGPWSHAISATHTS